MGGRNDPCTCGSGKKYKKCWSAILINIRKEMMRVLREWVNRLSDSWEKEHIEEAAAKANGHVMHLMTFKAQTISYPRYQEMQPGSEEEARYIWLLLNSGK